MNEVWKCEYADERPCPNDWQYQIKRTDDKRPFHLCLEHLYVFAVAEQEEQIRLTKP